MRVFRSALVVVLAFGTFFPCHAGISPAGANFPSEDTDSDNLVNSEEATIDTVPEKLDTDEDGWPDGWEVVPRNPQITVLAAQETRYALIDVGEAYRVCGIHDNGDILFASMGATPGTEIGKIWRQGTLTIIGEGKQGSFLGPTSDGSVYFTESTTTTEHSSDIYGNRTTTTRAMRRYHPTEAPSGEPHSLAEEDRTWTGTLPFPFPSTPPPTTSLGGFHSGQWSDVWQYITGNMTEQLSGYSIVANPPNFGSYQKVKTKLGRMNQVGDQAFEMTYWLKANFERPTGNQTQTANLDLAMGMGGWRGNPDLYSAGSWRVSTEAALQDLLTKEVVVGQYKYATAKVGAGIVQFNPTQNTPDTPLDGVTFVSEINDGVPYHWPFFLAATSNGTRLVLDNAGELEMVPAPPPASSTGIIGQSLSANLVIPTGSGIWRNSKSLSASELLTSYYWSTPSIQFVSPITHLLAGTATRKKSDNGIDIPIENQERRAVLMIPCDIAVDANRDGTIKFAGNFYNFNNAGKSPDKTSESRPFRFWCNDDDDGDSGAGEEQIGTNREDHTDGVIKTMRDLEDFSRLHLYFGGLHETIAAGIITVGLEWRNTSGGTPSINVYQAAELDGGDQYLKSTLAAGNQVLGAVATKLGTVVAGSSFKFPVTFWGANPLTSMPLLSENNPNRFLIFEGCEEGKGQLVMTFWKGSEKIGEGPGVWLDLLNIKKMYERAKGTPLDGLPAPFESSASQPNPTPTAYVEDPNGHVFSKPHNEDNSLIVFVHGIHGPGESGATAYSSNINAAQTVFKRLWHQGFKGRFAFYKWPALTPGPSFQGLTGFEYNNSEYRAWKYGRGLAQFVNSFDKASKNLFAHSQGNNVCGAALTFYGLTVNNYVLSQAAVAAGCYDVSGGANGYQRFLQAEATKPTPDSANDLGYRGYLATLGVAGNVVNFHNFDDFALASGFTGPFETNWEKNQEGSKPDDSLSNGNYYAYTPTQPIAQRCHLVDALVVRPVLDPHESMALVARARSKAVGALGTTGGSIKDSLDLSQMRDGLNTQFFTDSSDDHGAQVSRCIQQVWPYYEQLGIKLEVIPLPE